MGISLTFYDGADCIGGNKIKLPALNFCDTVGYGGGKSGFHASGHIHGSEKDEEVKPVKREMLISMHSESRDLFWRFERI